MYMVTQNRLSVDTLSDQISSGIAVRNPGDSTASGSIAQLKEMMERTEGHKTRISAVKGFLEAQDNVLNTAEELLIRSSEIATQAADESNSPETRAALAAEVYQIRDHLASLANTTYQGRYLFGGAADNTPPYSATDGTRYVNPALGDLDEQAGVHYVFNTDPAARVTREVKVSDDVKVTVNTRADLVFGNGLEALERLSRALAGYETNSGGDGHPDLTGEKYAFPEDKDAQTKAIQGCIDRLKNARQEDIIPERVDVAGRLRRVETGESLITLSQTSGQEVLDRLQNTDIFKAASDFSLAQTALQSALTVNTRLLGQSILDYI